MNIATFNVRGLRKEHLQKKDKNNSNSLGGFFTWLRNTNNDILALQELRFRETLLLDDQRRYNQIFKCSDAVWTTLSFSSTHTYLDGRIILAHVTSSSTPFAATFCVMYAPAKRKERKLFFQDCLSLPFFLSPPPNVILLGDLNYQHHRRCTHPPFREWINTHLINCITPPNTTPTPTFIHSGNKSRTTIDYILYSFSLFSQTSDHDMLTLTLTPSLAPRTGRGLWRMNTQILDNAEFLSALDLHLSTLEEPQPSETR